MDYLNISLDVLIRIEDILFKQELSNDNIKIGELVLDLKDGTYSFIDTIFPDLKQVVLMNEHFVESGVPIHRLRHLTVLSVLDIDKPLPPDESITPETLKLILCQKNN